MPVPVLAGFAGLASTIFSTIKGFLAGLVALNAIRLGIMLATLTFIAAATYTLYTTFETIINNLATSIPPALVVVGSWVIPTQLAPCIVALISAHAAALVYRGVFVVVDLQKRL